MHHYFESITNKSGDVLVGYFARVIDPVTQNTVTLAADNNGTPIVTVSGVENMAKSDENGNLSLYVEPGTYNLEIYAPNATSFILRVPNVAMNSGRGPQGEQGEQGPQGEGLETVMEPTGSAIVGFKAPPSESLPRTIYDKLLDNSYSVFDFMTDAQRNDVRNFVGSIEVTDAINECFAAAQRDGKSVYFPDGAYLVGRLLFGNQSTTSGSISPSAMFGGSFRNVQLRAKAGLTGTVLQSWSVAGVTFSGFSITTTGTAAQAWDCDWKVGPGPSTRNVIQGIRVDGGSAPTHVSLRNLNDCSPRALYVAAADPSQCCIDMTQTGGASSLEESICAVGFLRWGSQNGRIAGGYFSGIALAQGALNYTHMDSLYLYGNTSKNAVVWSDSYALFQSARAITFTACQFICSDGDLNVTSMVDINAYSALIFNGCQFIGTSATNFLGPNSRADMSGEVGILLNGGSFTPRTAGDNTVITRNARAGFYYKSSSCNNDALAAPITATRSGTSAPSIPGLSVSPSSASCQYFRTENSVSWRLRVVWNGATAGTPAVIATLIPYSVRGLGGSSEILYNGNSFAGASATASMASDGRITFYNAATGAPLSFGESGDLEVGGTYEALA